MCCGPSTVMCCGPSTVMCCGPSTVMCSPGVHESHETWVMLEAVLYSRWLTEQTREEAHRHFCSLSSRQHLRQAKDHWPG